MEMSAGDSNYNEQWSACASTALDHHYGALNSCTSGSSMVANNDLERGVSEERSERDCRICHLGLENREHGFPIVLGCSCKDDLAAAHRECAETWFKIRGSKICEICGSTAKNVAGSSEAESAGHQNDSGGGTESASAALSETRVFWRGHRLLNFLLACMVFAFLISWLFHFNVSV